jgi:hypothetical protein
LPRIGNEIRLTASNGGYLRVSVLLSSVADCKVRQLPASQVRPVGVQPLPGLVQFSGAKLRRAVAEVKEA